MATNQGLPRLGRWYVGLVITGGLLLLGLSLLRLFTGAIDLRWLGFAALAVLSASLAIKIPTIPARLSVSETFVFTALLVFGPEAGTMVVAVDGLVGSRGLRGRRSDAVYKTLFNICAPTLALWVAWLLSVGAAGLPPLAVRPTPVDHLLPPLFLLAVVYFVLNTWGLAFAIALQTRGSALSVWSQNFLWVAINYLGGASVSALLVLLYNSAVVTPVALAIIVPLLAAIYLTFRFAMGRAEESIAHLAALNQAAQQRTDLENELREAHKMESVGRLAAGVAHDFNNLLTPIIGYADLLLEDNPTDAHREELLQIRQAAGRARDLTRQLLAFGRKQILSLKPVDLRLVIADFESLLRRMVREDIQIEVRQPDSLGLVRADVSQIEQVLMNLAVNAQDAMPSGGRLTFELSETTVSNMTTASQSGLMPGRYVALVVRDTGSGMDADTLSRVCEPFFTTKERGKGTGLGLSTVYGIVKQHGGHLEVSSVAGQGSIFTVYLPRFDGADVSQALASTDATESSGGHGRILVVEDSEAVRRMTNLMLERQGYQVLSAGSGRAALDIMRATRQPIDLLLTDIILPDLSGRELASRMLAAKPGLKVVYMSGYAADVIAHRGVLEEGIQFLQKPFSPQALEQAVRGALAAARG